MIKKNLILILFLLIIIQMYQARAASNTVTKRFFVHLKVKNVAQRSLVANYIHIDQIIEDSAYATVNSFDLAQLKKFLPHMLVESHQLTIKKALLGEEKDLQFPRRDAAYHTYQEVVDELQATVRRYPQISELFSVGETVEGSAIQGIRITAAENRKSRSFIPGILFVGAHHAREHLSVEVPMKLIQHLLSGYQTNMQIKSLIDNRDIYFIPMLNSDGAMFDIKGRRYHMWRKNRILNSSGRSYGVDLNRNYSFGWGTGGSSTNERSDVFMGPKPFSEPETLAVKQFIETHANVRILLSFHTFSELILYPWGGKRDSVGGRDQRVFEKMAKTMAKWNRYKPMQASDLYVASGDTCDWAYGEHGVFCFTFELTPSSRWGGGFYPGSKVIEKTYQANVRPALYLIDKALSPYSVLEK